MLNVTAVELTGSKKRKGGAQEGSGRPRKNGVRSEFYLSERGREILQLAKTREDKKQLTPAIEAVLEDYAQRYQLPVMTPKSGQEEGNER